MRPRRQMVRKGLILGFFLALPLTLNYYSPALMTGGTAERVATFSLFTWTAIFASSLVIGRAFCGYGCPFNGLQTAWEKVSGRPNRRIRRLRWVKYTLWAAWAGAVAAFAVSTGGWQRVDLLYMTPHVVSVDSPASLLVYYVLVAVTLAAAALGKRGASAASATTSARSACGGSSARASGGRLVFPCCGSPATRPPVPAAARARRRVRWACRSPRWPRARTRSTPSDAVRLLRGRMLGRQRALFVRAHGTGMGNSPPVPLSISCRSSIGRLTTANPHTTAAAPSPKAHQPRA